MSTPFEDAQTGLEKIKSATLRALAKAADGMTNAEIADALGLRTSFSGSHKNYLTYTVLHILMDEGKLTTTVKGRHRYYHLKKS